MTAQQKLGVGNIVRVLGTSQSIQSGHSGRIVSINNRVLFAYEVHFTSIDKYGQTGKGHESTGYYCRAELEFVRRK